MIQGIRCRDPVLSDLASRILGTGFVFSEIGVYAIENCANKVKGFRKPVSILKRFGVTQV